jgi:hypothetical protein
MCLQIGSDQLQLDNDTIIRITNAALNDQSRLNADNARIDLWGKKKARLPDSAFPVLVHKVFCQIEWFDQVIWFTRTKERDELWVFTDFYMDLHARLVARKPPDRADALLPFGQKVTCAISVSRSGSPDESLLGLLSAFFTTPAGALIDLEHITALGYVSEAHLRLLLSCIESYRERKRIESEEYSRQARENETEIIHVARELGLNPEPAGIGPIQWYANCPGKQHRLMITTSDDQFGCGYCRVKGGVDELRAFIEKEGGHEHLA